jgi:hypothetical protein
MMSPRRRRSRGWRALAVLPVVLIALTACDGEPSASGFPVIPTPTGAPPPASTSSTGEPTPSSTPPFRAKMPGPALRSWVTLVLQAKYQEACLATEQVADGDQDPGSCTSSVVVKGLTDLHDRWAKPGVEVPPKGKVTVAPLTPRDGTAMASDTAVKVGGRTLHDLMLIGDPGAKTTVSFVLHKRDDVWYLASWYAAG